MNLTVAQITAATHGTIKAGSGHAPVLGVSTDSRTIGAGELFIALKGPTFDGHDYVMNACRSGASGAVIESTRALEELPPEFNIILVDDTLVALGALASYARSLYKIPLVAVGGSTGKTTTKEMIAACLEGSKKVLKNEGNMNNLIGLPLTLLKLAPEHEAAVVELGISEEGEMERLVEISRPDVALLTNIGKGHLMTLGDIEGVARAKAALFTGLGHRAVKVVNLDDALAVRCAHSAGGDGTITYSARPDATGADVRVTDWFMDTGLAGMNVLYEVRGESVSIRFDTPSEANVINGAAAIAASLPMGAELDDVRQGLSSYRSPGGRMEVVRSGGATLLDDTYNANPDSVAMALRTLSHAPGRKVAVLGDMLELGTWAEHEHRGIGRLAAELGTDVVVGIGEFSKATAAGAEGAGALKVLSFTETDEAASELITLIKQGDTVLVKGSRRAGLERLVERIKAGAQV